MIARPSSAQRESILIDFKFSSYITARPRTAGQSSVLTRRGLARALWAIVLPMVLATSPAHGEETRSFVLRAKRVFPVSPDQPAVLEPGVIVVRDGRIVAIGSDIDVPPDLPVVNMKDATIVPGFVASATGLLAPHSGDESIAAGYRAVDAFDTYGDFSAALASGVTTVHLSPGQHRLLTGQGAIVRLGGAPADRILIERADLTINLGAWAFGPPRDVTYQTPASSDVAIPPSVRQRPDSRLGQFLALDEALEQSRRGSPASIHVAELASAWERNLPLRLQVRRSADISGALEFLKRHQRTGYLVGGAQAWVVADEIAEAGVPLVYTLAGGFRNASREVGHDPDAIEADVTTLSRLKGVTLALAGPIGGRVGDLRLAAATALRAGLDEQAVLAAITRIPAEILGIGDRVGHLAPGMDADLVVLTGDPLATSSHVRRTYVGGVLAYEAPDVSALVVRAGTIWVDENTRVDNGAVLIENGVISAVGPTVPHPPLARVIDAGPDAFVTPGFIDAFGHLGFDGDRSSTPPDISFASAVGVPDVTERRVARAGITTVLTAPYAASAQGSQIAAIKTSGKDREARVVRKTAGVIFDVHKSDPMGVGKKLKARLEAAKKYLEKWQKYEKELAEWKEKKAKGELTDGGAKREEVSEQEGEVDPITGTWAVTLSGGPIGEPQSATMKLRLTGSEIEGRITVPGEAIEGKITGTLDGTHISAQIDIETPFGPPMIEADIVEEDHIVGTIALADIQIDLDARRTDKSAVEFKVARRRTRGKDGRPLPPSVDESLEPLRAVLEKKIPIVIAVDTAAQIEAVLKVAKEFEVSLVLLDAAGATAHAEKLVEQSVGVIVPKRVLRRRHDRWYHQSDDLSRKGVSIAFQSDAEDGARALLLSALHAVERGLSADAALAAFTTQVSRMFKLDDKIGSLQIGRQGDLVIFSGHPFEAGSRVQRVIIGGEEVE